MTMGTRERYHAVALFAVLLFSLGPLPASAELISLRSVPVPKPANLTKYVADENAAIRLGKALFWDMQVGSDGVTACATCHFHAGTDSRVKNSLNPGNDADFDGGKGVNSTLTLADFPFVRFQDPTDRNSPVTRNVNDVIGAQGVNLATFKGIRSGNTVDNGRGKPSVLFSSQGRNVRQVTGRNSPSVINAVFNYANFLDGRANHFFNGVNPFGYEDVAARILVNSGSGLQEMDLSLLDNRLDNASLASQAVGPPLNGVEMSWEGRSFPDLGRKLLPARPLAKQVVSATDSTLGFLSQSPGKGLNVASYGEMIKSAFRPEYWNNTSQKVIFSGLPKVSGTVNPGKISFKRAGLTVSQGDGYSQMEANFAFFFGMAVMLYESTLVSDDTPFDRFVSGDATALTQRQQQGLNIFLSGGAGCTACHVGAEFTAVSISNTKNPLEPSVIELMPMGDNQLANYDIGFYNIGVTLTGDDPGRGGNDPFGLPLSFTRQFLNRANMPFAADFIAQPGCINTPLSDPPRICPPPADPPLVTRAAVNGAFKTPGLRNVELTGPYFHNGSAATLMQVVDFYVRGGNFHDANLSDLDPFMNGISGLAGGGKEAERQSLVDFLLALTDERVRWERAPFDHPQLFVPAGHQLKISGDPRRVRVLDDDLIEVPAVGRNGRSQAQGPLRPFLYNGDPGFHFNP